MPHGSSYLLRTIVVLLTPFLLAAGLALFWVVVDLIDGCLHEPEDVVTGDEEDEEQREAEGGAQSAGGIGTQLASQSGQRQGKLANDKISRKRMTLNPLAMVQQGNESVLEERSVPSVN